MKPPAEAIRLRVALQCGCWGVFGAAMVLRAAAVELQSGQLSMMVGPHLMCFAAAKSLKVTLQALCGTVPVRA